MPVKPLPLHSNLNHLRHQARDLRKAHAGRDPRIAQLLREFHPRFARCTDTQIFAAPITLTDAQLTIAREAGFPSWPRIKQHIEQPSLSDRLDLPHQERIEDPLFRAAVRLIDAGDASGLRSHLFTHPYLLRKRLPFEGSNYFSYPSLLEFVAENPVRHGRLSSNVLEVTRVILEAGVDQASLDETLMLVATGSVARESGLQVALLALLCDSGADPNSATHAAAVHGEQQSLQALLRRGAIMDLPVAATLGDLAGFRQLLPAAGTHARHLALALAVQYQRTEIVRLLLDAGEDPNRYNPPGGHSHGTPLHHAAGGGNEELVRLLLARGARLDVKDVLWMRTPADWAEHEGRTELAAWLRSQMFRPHEQVPGNTGQSDA